jgi:branched-chain amino acid transport system permease protein
MDGTILAQSVFNGLVDGWIYVLISLGLTLVLSIMGIMQMAHGQLYMFGAYCAYFASYSFGLGYFESLIVSTVVIGAFGILLEKYFFHPFLDDPDRGMIVSLSLVLILQTVAAIFFAGTTKVHHNPFSQVQNIAGITVPLDRLIVIIISIVLVTALFLFINLTKTGQSMVAVSQDRQAAALQGINIARVSSAGMMIGCALAAAAGALVGSMLSLDTTMGDFALAKGIAVIVLGGLGSLPGAVIGGIFLGLIDGVIPTLLSSQMASIFGFAIVIIILIVRPQGLMGHE